ncbi:MAG: hypothetical protein PGMFKBFP_02303 [Anaerolineales bacterium]|nr:hypothetical protein [Anaerolineales bacterium]
MITPVFWTVPEIFATGMVLVYVLGELGVLSVPTTSTVMVQRPGMSPTCAGTVPPVMLTILLPGVAVITPAPQVVDAFGTAATRIPFATVPGRLSVTETLTSGESTLFCRVIVIVERPPAWTTVA